MATLDERFAEAQKKVQTLPKRPPNETLLELYALYKQGSEGDVRGARPGLFDVKGRAKYDAWAARRGLTGEAAKEAYVALVERLLAG
jgi:acyl-CoA-binding protein